MATTTTIAFFIFSTLHIFFSGGCPWVHPGVDWLVRRSHDPWPGCGSYLSGLTPQKMILLLASALRYHSHGDSSQYHNASPINCFMLFKYSIKLDCITQGLSQDLETGCPKLTIVEYLDVFFLSRQFTIY